MSDFDLEIGLCSPLFQLKFWVENEDVYSRKCAANEIYEFIVKYHGVVEDYVCALRLLNVLAKDPEPMVKTELVEQLPRIAQFSIQVAALVPDFNFVQDLLIPILGELFNEQSVQIRKAFHAALLSLLESGVLNTDDVREHLWHGFEEWITPLNIDSIRSEYIHLMLKISPVLGQKFAEEYILPHFLEFCTDPSISVRKVCSVLFGSICHALGEAITESHLMNKFYDLCEDSVWGVRKSCAESAHEVSKCCSPQTRGGELTTAFYNLLTDQSRWVRSTAYQHLGPFILTFAIPELTGFCLKDGRICKLPNLTPSTPVPTYEVFANDSPSATSLRVSPRKRTVSTSYDLPADSSHVRIHLDNVDDYNSFSFWKIPFPELDIDVDIVEGRPTNIRVTSRLADSSTNKVYTSEFDVDLQEGGSNRIVSTKTSGTSDLSSSLNRVSFSEDSGGTRWRSCDLMRQASSPCEERLLTKQNIVPQQLLAAYIGMLDNDTVRSVDIELAQHCAYSIPAVLFTIGPQHWPLLRPVYQALAQDMQWKVRRTLAFSLHDMALMLPHDCIASDLLPVFHDLVRDVDEVKSGLVANLALLCHRLPPHLLPEVMDKLPELYSSENDKCWRYRLQFAHQLVGLFDVGGEGKGGHVFLEHVTGLMWRLLLDKVADVRLAACQLALHIIHTLYQLDHPPSVTANGTGEDEEIPSSLSKLLHSLVTVLGDAPLWIHRQLYVHLCILIITSGGEVLPRAVAQGLVFERLLVSKFCQLAVQDPVPNVRLKAATGLVGLLRRRDGFLSTLSSHAQAAVLDTVRALRNDSDRDVRQMLTGLPQLASGPADVSCPLDLPIDALPV